MGDSRLPAHQTSAQPDKAVWGLSSYRRHQETRSPKWMSESPLRACLGHSTKPVLQNQSSAQWRRQYPFSGPGKHLSGHIFKRNISASQGQNMSSGSRAQASESDLPWSGAWLGPCLNTHFPICKMSIMITISRDHGTHVENPVQCLEYIYDEK